MIHSAKRSRFFLRYSLLGLVAVLATGCSLTLDLHGSDVLNMRARAGMPEQGQSVSELIEVAILQLKSVPEDKQHALINKLGEQWAAHRSQMNIYRVKGNFPEVLAPFLAYPATLLELKRPDEIFVVNPRDHYTREIPLHYLTKHLLVMTLGSKPELHSIELFDVGPTTGTISLCFHQYGVYRYGSGRSWYCPQAPVAH